MGRSGSKRSHSTSSPVRRTLDSYDFSAAPPDLLPHPDAPVQGEAGGQAADLLASPEYRAALRSLGRTLIVDMDDTLNTNTVLYLTARRALLDCYHRITPERDPIEMGFRQKEISNSLIPEYGFTPKRWRIASLTAGEEFAGRPLTEPEQAEILEAAEIAFGAGDLMPGVEETLELVQQAGIEMLLLTKGEQATQERKIRTHGLDRFFGQIEIVPRKDAALLGDLIERYELSDPVMIGDSEASDIKPAQEIGIDGILIDKGAHAWKVETVDGGVEAPTVSSFPEAVQLLVEQAIADRRCRHCGQAEAWDTQSGRFLCRSWWEMEGPCPAPDDDLVAA